LFLGGCGNASTGKGKVKLSSELFNEIVEGHKFIEQSTVCLSGTVVEFKRVKLELNSDPDSIKFESPRQYQFYKKHDLARVEYVQPIVGTQIAPDHKYNDITTILLRTKDYDYYYHAYPTTDNPYPSADVTKSKRSASKLVDISLYSDLYVDTNVLTTTRGGKIIEFGFLKTPIDKIENRECNGVPNALWIIGSETTSKGKSGGKEYGNWLFVFDPNRHYALLRHEYYVKDKNNDYIIHCTNNVSSQITDNGTVVPKEIIDDWYIKDDGRYIDRKIVNITSTEVPDDALFTESSFKETGRYYNLHDESPEKDQR
jgi:hypothetical protein